MPGMTRPGIATVPKLILLTLKTGCDDLRRVPENGSGKQAIRQPDSVTCNINNVYYTA